MANAICKTAILGDQNGNQGQGQATRVVEVVRGCETKPFKAMGSASTESDGHEFMTSVINEVVEAVIGLSNATSPFDTVTRGALPTDMGLVCEIGPTSPQTVYLSKNAIIPLDLTFNGKHKNLKTLTDAMNDIHSALTRAKTYPADENGRWQIVDIANQTIPEIIGREENNEWLAASAVIVTFYWKGD